MSTHARLMLFLCAVTLTISGTPARADDLPEYRLKTAFLYNFTMFTEWPAETDATLNLCVYGNDPFGTDLDGLQGKAVGAAREGPPPRTSP